MAKKPAAAIAEPDRKNIMFWLSTDDHKLVRKAAAECGQPMSEFSRLAVMEKVERVLGGKP